MIVVTLICVVFGGRIEHLRRHMTFHESEAKRFYELGSLSSRPEEKLGCGVEEVEHEALAGAYRKAVCRPWTIVDEEQVRDWAAFVRFGMLPNSSEIAVPPEKQSP